MIGDYISVITPLLLHMLLTEAVVFFFGSSLDVTTCTAITAAAVIPAAAWMYRRDRRRHGKQWEVYGKNGKNPARYGVFCFAAGAVLNILWSGILNRLHISEYFSNQTQEALFAARILVQIIGLGILVPIAEELIFRGLIYQRMKRLMPLWAAALLSSLLFAAYHGNMIQMIFAFPMALALTWVYERGKGFAYPVLFHMGANLAAVILNLL